MASSALPGALPRTSPQEDPKRAPKGHQKVSNKNHLITRSCWCALICHSIIFHNLKIINQCLLSVFLDRKKASMCVQKNPPISRSSQCSLTSHRISFENPKMVPGGSEGPKVLENWSSNQLWALKTHPAEIVRKHPQATLTAKSSRNVQMALTPHLRRFSNLMK